MNIALSRFHPKILYHKLLQNSAHHDENIHALATAMIAQARHGRHAEARERLGELHSLSDQFMATLQHLIDMPGHA